ncbi:MAG: glycosyltransferase family 2 protein [Candidatus Sericytochromatia bacterium]
MSSYSLPLVSVMMPAHNAAAYLEEAVESVAAQSYPHKELIIVENGSTDHTAELMYQLCKRYVWVRGVTLEKASLAQARNKAFQLAQGDYLALLDADDRYLPHALYYLQTELAAARYRNPRVGLCYGSLEMMDAEGKVYQRVQVPAPLKGRRLLRQFTSVRMVLPSACMLFRDAAAAGLPFDEDLGQACDLRFQLQVAQAHDFVRVNRLITQYRRHPGQATHSYGILRYQGESVFFRELLPLGLDSLFPKARTPEKLAWELDRHVGRAVKGDIPPYDFLLFMARLAQELDPQPGRQAAIEEMDGRLIPTWIQEKFQNGRRYRVKVDVAGYAQAVRERLAQREALAAHP